ncbi:SURF6-domain-containing protein [Coniochaeta ligniaria NRRL 30616]|uniref:SURF6-domain-containing protein n=1 Tax=Coniochaeta ligniaria NRRL 30616 TaxID=1408157 RepID=A0A1J7IFI7_9PEZI|nr:SURF6-domain-containing protein [Coniochaeta ligniaria NRRL 30616]
MAEASLQDRLREHSKAFDGLLSLIPAKMYYGEDTSDQWKKKKQTKAEAKAAKRNKLDPDSELNKNAKEVMDERARNKRKLRDMQESPEADSEEEQDDVSLDLDVEKEKPGEGLKKKVAPAETETEETASKKPKLTEDEPQEELSEAAKAKAAKKLAKQQKKEEKDLKKKAKKEAKSDKTTTGEPTEDADAEPAEEDQSAPEKKGKPQSKKTKDVIHESTESDPTPEEDAEMEQISLPGLADEEDSTAASTPHSPVFDTAPEATSNPPSVEEAASTTTSSLASAVAPSEKPKHIKIPTDTTALRARLAARIEALRAARKADGSDGKPILTRSELIEERRRKQAQRKAHKKELRLKAKQEEDLKREEALASARNSPGGSLMSPMIPIDDEVETSFSFGRVAFGDGTTLSRDLTYEKESGPQKKKLDPKSALAKVEAQKRRLAELDDDKRKDILEKETWLAARRKAEGEKVRDDEGLLKKAVKRKDKAKQKSEKEWKERKAGVAKGIHDRQKKREANLQARRDGKGQKGKKKSGPTKKKAARPGFEGSFSVGGGKKR